MTTSHASAAAPLGRRRKPRRSNAPTIVFAIPGVVFYFCLVVFPLALSLYYSFTDKNLLNPSQDFVGFANYIKLMGDETFLRSFLFTAALTTVTFFVVNALSLVVALLLDRVGRLFFGMRMVFFIPVALSGVIVAFVWSTILTDNGLLNTGLNAVGLSNFVQSWLGTPFNAQASVIAVTAWQSMGLSIVVYLAGLQTIPRELIDASRIDGASRPQSFRHITWPLLAPSVTINSTLLLINGFKSYDMPVVLTGTGPAGATMTVATEVIRVGFNLNRAGVASAMAIILLLVVAGVTALVVALLQRREVSA